MLGQEIYGEAYVEANVRQPPYLIRTGLQGVLGIWLDSDEARISIMGEYMNKEFLKIGVICKGKNCFSLWENCTLLPQTTISFAIYPPKQLILAMESPQVSFVCNMPGK